MRSLSSSRGRYGNNSVTKEGTSRSTPTSKKTQIKLQEHKEIVHNRHVRHNPYTDEYMVRNTKKKSK